MKIVYGNYYFALEAVSEIPKNLSLIYFKNKTLLPKKFSFNVIKITKDLDKITFSNYPDLATHAHPYLFESITINTKNSLLRKRIYKNNPVVLHRLETILSASNLRNDALRRLTEKEEALGFYSKKHIKFVSRKDYWNQLCLEHNFIDSISPNSYIKVR